MKMMMKNDSEPTKGNILLYHQKQGLQLISVLMDLQKAAINSFVEGLGYLLCKDGIRVNAIAPGVVATDMTGFSPDENLAYTHNSTGRLYLPEEMAEAATFLISDASATVSGQILTCNNARTINARWK